ncbi:MAG: DMT family transporter [Acidimicrobiia bacterium]|nr:DMT family transporter [Acidimicrobiia bacterium]
MTGLLQWVQRKWIALPGVLLVALGAGLWGTDGLFRRGLALELPSATVVFWEHLILVVVTAPLLVRFYRNRPELAPRDLFALILVGVGASALATMLFTEAFSYGDPTTPLLLQKLQPVIAVLGAYVLLRERLLPRYGVYFLLAVGSAYLISFSDPTNVSVSQLEPALLAVGAASLWGLGTVVGRHLTAKIEPNQLTALRFAIGLPASAIILVWRGETSAASGVSSGDLGTLVGLALIPGLAAITVYYRGLSATPASLATLAELAFPLTAILIGWSVFDTVPSRTQWLGIAILASTIVVMARAARQHAEALGVVAPARASARPTPASERATS